MKRIFTLIIGLIVMSQVMDAQTMEFRNNGTPIAAGETVTFYAAEDDWGTVSITTNPTDKSNDLRLYNLTDNKVDGKATITMTSNTLGTDTRQWCMGGECVSTSATTYDKEFTIPAGESIQVQYDVEPEPEQFGEMTTELSVRVGLAASTSITIRFVYSDNAGMAGITDAEQVTEVAHYGADGSLLSSPRRGLNIVKLSNGKTVKKVKK